MSQKLFQRSLLATTMIAGLAIVSPAYAQDPAVEASTQDATPATQENAADTPEAQPATVDDEMIIVTGSRIISPNIVSLAPIQVVSEADIDESGAINIQEVLLENPAFGTPGLSRTNSAFLTSGGGVSTVDLRDLGSDRTLVLVNSRRVVAGLPGSASVDLNVIPTQFVDRIDILTGGASSLYGSDAVAGVVNVIYKRNFQGLLAEGQYGVTEEGDSPRYQVSLTAGGNFLEERGNLAVHFGYTNEKGLLSRQRDDSKIDNRGRFWYVTGDPADYKVPQIPFFSSFVPQGRFTAGDYTFTYSPTGQLQPCFTSNGSSCTSFRPANPVTGFPGVADIGSGVGPNGFNRQAFRTLAVPVERYVFATRGHYDITDNISAILEGTYVKTSASREIEPFPLGSDDIIPTGLIPIETFVNGVPTLNPLVPGAIAAQAQDEDLDGLRDISFARRLSEVGGRFSDTTRDFFRFVTGLEGKFMGDRFHWDVTYNFGETTEAQVSNGQVNVTNFRFALAAIPDVNDLNANGSTTDAICADPTARAQGCVPINLFGFNSITPEALKYINAQGNYRTKINQQVWAANLSGELIQLPAGPLGIAVGAEYREEKSEEDWDALTNAGLNAGNALPDTKGKFNVKELYGEVNIPLMKDRPFFHQLNLRAAGRLSDYSTVGSVQTYSLGADWAPVEALRFRGTYAKAVRAPNIAELFTGPSQTFPTGLQDPCAGVTPADTSPLGQRCLAAPGVLTNIAANGGVFTLSQADEQGISGFDSGNPNLDAERSRSVTFGAVFAPRNIPALRNLVLSADYYNILVKDAIVNPDRRTILNQCYIEGNAALCDFITRRTAGAGSYSPGSLEFIDSAAVNGAELKAEGIDFVAQYRTPLDRFLGGWNMSARVAWTHLLDGYVISLPGLPENRFAGEIGTSKDRVNGTIAFNSSKVGINFTGTYIGKAYEDDVALADYGLDDEAISVPSEFYLDTQLTFRPTRTYEFYLGVDNLLDNKAPVILQGSIFNITGSQTAADVYDIFGRRYYAGVRLRF